jgi:type VI secretion system protein ImpA
VHPQLDASEHDDPTMRLNALAPLAAGDAVLADLRAAALAPVRGSLTVRQLELGLGQASAAPDEPVPTEAGVLQGLQALLDQHPDTAATARAAHQAALGMAEVLNRHLGEGHAGDLAPLTRLLGLLVRAVDRLGPAGIDASPTPDTAGAAGAAIAAQRPLSAGGIATREDAVRELDRICTWLERHEPANPAPLLIRRAQRLMNKSFMEIIRDLAPDGLSQIENLAGPDIPR